MKPSGSKRRRLWAAALAGVVVAGGCASPVAPRPRVGYARLEALTALHPGSFVVVPGRPATSAAASLERWAAAARAGAAHVPAGIPQPSSRTFAPAPGQNLALPPVASALERVEKVTEEELARLADELEARARGEVARRTREATLAARAQDAKQRSEISAALERERRQVLVDARARVNNLRLRAANLERDLARPELPAVARGPEQERLEQARAELAAAQAEQSARLDEVQRRYDAELAALDQAEAERVAREVSELRARLAQERADVIARERARLAVPLEEAVQKLVAGLEVLPIQPIMIGPGAVGREIGRSSGAMSRQSASWSRGMVNGGRALERERQDLLDSIREDTRATAEIVAYNHRWRVVWERPRGARVTEITTRVESWLREYWGTSGGGGPSDVPSTKRGAGCGRAVWWG